MKVKITKPVVYCMVTQKQAVPLNEIGTVKGMLQGTPFLVVEFDENSSVLLNQELNTKTWCFTKDEFELIN